MPSKPLVKVFEPYAGKRISEKQIREMLKAADYAEYHQLIQDLVSDDFLVPAKSSGSNGMNPPLFKRYRVAKSEVPLEDYTSQIRLLHSVFHIEGYLNQPKVYEQHRKWITPLDAWLKSNDNRIKPAMSVNETRTRPAVSVNDNQADFAVSINERSFQIFHLEKALKYDKSLAAVLNYNPGIRELLNYYDTPEPFFTYNIVAIGIENKMKSKSGQANRATEMNMQHKGMQPIEDNLLSENRSVERIEVNILISENKDTWYTLRKLMNQSNHKLFGTSFHVLLYGEGKKINRKYSTLTDYNEVTFKGYKSTYYYFGDIDYEGIHIFTDLVKQNPALDIRLMTPLYQKMLEKAKGIPLPVTKDKQSSRNLESFLSWFEQEEQVMIQKLLDKRQYIPQEILNFYDFLEAARYVRISGQI